MEKAETDSEELFEQFCNKNNIEFNKIGREKTRTPDYCLNVSGQNIVVEIKQFEPKKSHKSDMDKIANGEFVCIDMTPGQGVRKKITDAAPQLRKLAKGKCPAVLILFNNAILTNGCSPYNVRVGMYGLESIIFNVPVNRFDNSKVVDRKFAGKRKVTPNQNTTLSAVGVLEKLENGTELKMFHNIYADIPLNPRLFDYECVKHFTLSAKENGQQQDWVEITTQ